MYQRFARSGCGERAQFSHSPLPARSPLPLSSFHSETLNNSQQLGESALVIPGQDVVRERG